MKLRTKLMAGLGGLVLAGSFALTAASAADVDVDAFVGATGSLNPAVGLSPSSGNYTFGSAACVAVSVDSDAEAGTCTISSSGVFVNTICGTGTATGTATIASSVAVPPGSSETVNASYTISFTAGIGILRGTETNDGDAAAGIVDIIPTGGNCVSGVTQFTASGVTEAS